MVIAAMDTRVVTAIAVAGGLALFGVLLALSAAGELRKRRKAKVPASFRPAPSDEELERRVLERYQLWGGVLVIFMALWLPAYWLYQPTALANKRENLRQFSLYGAEHSEERSGGAQLYKDFCASCHGKKGEGSIQKYVIYDETRDYAEPPLNMIYPRYKEGGRSDDEITQIIRDAINRGRPGTPMPTWGFAFGGPMNTYQVDNLVAFIKEIQIPADKLPKPSDPSDGEAIFAANCAVCHGARGEGGVGPNLTVSLERFSREEIREAIEKGRININRPSMPAWGFLGDEAVSALVSFIESIQGS